VRKRRARTGAKLITHAGELNTVRERDARHPIVLSKIIYSRDNNTAERFRPWINYDYGTTMDDRPADDRHVYTEKARRKFDERECKYTRAHESRVRTTTIGLFRFSDVTRTRRRTYSSDNTCHLTALINYGLYTHTHT